MKKQIDNHSTNRTKSFNEKHRYVCITFNYIEQLFFLAFAVTGCVSIFAFTSSVRIPIRTISSVVRLKLCAGTRGIQRH